MEMITWPDLIALLQVVFTFLTVGIAFISIGMNRRMKAVDVSLGCQTRHSDVMERLYKLPYNDPAEGGGHAGLDTHSLVSESELFSLFNIYWHLIHDEYQYWRDGYITNEMFFRWIDGIFDEFRADYAYFCRGAHSHEHVVTYSHLWARVRDRWFRSRSFARFVSEVERQAAADAPALDAGLLMKFRPRRYRRVAKKRITAMRVW
jgi:hypothetical protein